MKFIINNVKGSLVEGVEVIKKRASAKLGVKEGDLLQFRIIKESIDARRKPDIILVYSVLVEVDVRTSGLQNADVRPVEEGIEKGIEEAFSPGMVPDVKLSTRPVIVGCGPAGIFAGLLLAKGGYRPILLERGDEVSRRAEAVQRYWSTGELDCESNIQFGEGGAGTFSDGKLTTRINDRRCDAVLKEFHSSGAPEEILYRAKPHIGTDILKNVVQDMRNRIIGYGGEVRFRTQMTGLKLKNGSVIGVEVAGGEEIPAELVILAIGHSARDTFKVLHDSGIHMAPKPFSIGVRIEHPQSMINLAQYGAAAAHPRLGAAEYGLFHKMAGRTAYTFCMCPGGTVTASASETGSIVTNGMSEYARNRENANSALVVSVEPEDFGQAHPLAGVEFQREWERLAYSIGGGSGAAPVQRREDFVQGRVGRIGAVKPSYTGEVTPADLNLCLPRFVTGAMQEGVRAFDRRLKGFGMKDALLTGVETRTSSPLRILRGDTLEAEGFCGLYPTGEGAGYAGGIVSAAVDGIRVAEKIISRYLPEG